MFLPRRLKAMGMIATGIGPIVVASIAGDVIEKVKTGQESVVTVVLLALLATVCTVCFFKLAFTKSGPAKPKVRDMTSTASATPMFLQGEEGNLIASLESKGGHKPLACTYLGGSGLPFRETTEIILFRLPDSFVFVRSGSTEQHSIHFSQLSLVEVSGPGTQTTNAGVSGGGFGVEGFLQGVAVAATLNAVTSRSTTNTFLRILSEVAEIYLHTSKIEPDQLKIFVSPAVVAMEGGKRRAISSARNSNIVGELEKLDSLRSAGVLNSEEFNRAKAKLLEN